MKLQQLTAYVLSAAALAACASDARLPTTPPQLDPLWAAGGGQTATLNRASSFEWASGLSVQPDGKGPYTHGECGVSSVTQLDNDGGDAFNHPSKDWSRLGRTVRQACGNAPRSLIVDYGDGVRETVSYLYVRRLWWFGHEEKLNSSPVFSNWIGTADLRVGARCGLLWYGRHEGSAKLQITETTSSSGTRQWIVQTQGEGLAYCDNTGTLVPMPFTVTVTDLARAP
jgi:hypothetical protein